MRLRMIFLMLVSFGASFCTAEDPSSLEEMKRRIAALKEQVRLLNEKVSALEKKNSVLSKKIQAFERSDDYYYRAGVDLYHAAKKKSDLQGLKNARALFETLGDKFPDSLLAGKAKGFIQKINKAVVREMKIKSAVTDMEMELAEARKDTPAPSKLNRSDRKKLMDGLTDMKTAKPEDAKAQWRRLKKKAKDLKGKQAVMWKCAVKISFKTGQWSALLEGDPDFPVCITGKNGLDYKRTAAREKTIEEINPDDQIVIQGIFMGLNSDGAVILEPESVRNEGFQLD